MDRHSLDLCCQIVMDLIKVCDGVKSIFNVNTITYKLDIITG